MAVDFIESFDEISTAQLADGGNARFHHSGGGVTVSTNFPRTGTQSALMGAELNKRLLPNAASRVIGVSVRIPSSTSFPASDYSLMGVFDGGTVGAALGSAERQIALCLTSLGKLCVYRGRWADNAGTKLGSDSSLALSRDVTYFIEFVTTIHSSAGVAEVWVDGVQWLNLTSQNTQNTANAYSNGIGLGQFANCYMDDLYVWSGSTARFGPKWRVKSILPVTGNGANDQWAKSTGSDAGALLDESPANNTDYISETTAGEKTTVAMGNVGLSGVVKAFTVDLWCQKGDVGARSIAPVQRMGGTDYDGTTVVLAQGWADQVSELRETSPATSSAYTVTEIDGMEIGAKLIA
jgi:hypothetical protein